MKSFELSEGRFARESANPPANPITRWLRTLAQSHCERCVAYLRRKYGAGPPDPEDCAQQALLQLAKLDWKVIANITSPKSFFYRAAENILISHKRRDAIRKRHALETRAGNPQDGFGEGAVFDPQRVLVKREELSVIEEVIRAMPQRRQQCFIMHRFEELSFAEIARRLQVSETTVRSHVESGLRDIKRAIDAMDQESGS